MLWNDISMSFNVVSTYFNVIRCHVNIFQCYSMSYSHIAMSFNVWKGHSITRVSNQYSGFTRSHLFISELDRVITDNHNILDL